MAPPVPLRLPVLLVLVFLLSPVAYAAADEPSSSPPAPSPFGDAPSPLRGPFLVPRKSPAPSPMSPFNSPPAPPERKPSPSPSPSHAPASEESPGPAPAADHVQKINVSGEDAAAQGEQRASGGGGMSGGKKAGLVLGVLVGAALVGLGAFVYKKRQDNIRRSRYGYAVRREML